MHIVIRLRIIRRHEDKCYYIDKDMILMYVRCVSVVEEGATDDTIQSIHITTTRK